MTCYTKPIISEREGKSMMNARAEVNRMINAIPDEKMIYVLSVLRGMSGFAMEEGEPDAFDLQLMAQAENDSDATVSCG